MRETSLLAFQQLNGRKNAALFRKRYPEKVKQLKKNAYELGKTHLHHTKYDANNPLANTVELCISCHTTLHLNQGNRPKLSGPFLILPHSQGKIRVRGKEP